MQYHLPECFSSTSTTLEWLCAMARWRGVRPPGSSEMSNSTEGSINSFAPPSEGGGGSSWEDRDDGGGGEGVSEVTRDGPHGCARSRPERSQGRGGGGGGGGGEMKEGSKATTSP